MTASTLVPPDRPVVVNVDTGPWWPMVLATVVLVGVTAYYAKKTGEMVAEMRRATKAEEHRPIRKRTDEAAECAVQCLIGIRMEHQSPGGAMAAAKALARDLGSEWPRMQPGPLAEHVHVCEEAFRLIETQYHSNPQTLVAWKRATQLALVTGYLLLQYLRGEALSEWPSDLPSTTDEVGAWLFTP